MKKYMGIKLLKRPGKNRKVVQAVVDIVRSVTPAWFTPSVQEYIQKDMLFQDIFVLTRERTIQAFLVFTSIDGNMYIMLMAARPEMQRKGLGTSLYKVFEHYVKRLGYECIKVQTVPEEVNINYKKTRLFYEKLGFSIVKHYTELWENGAIELEKRI